MSKLGILKVANLSFNAIPKNKILRKFPNLQYYYSMCANTFNLFTNKVLVIKAGIHKMLIRIANRKDTVREQSDLGLHCLSSCCCFFFTSQSTIFQSCWDRSFCDEPVLSRG